MRNSEQSVAFPYIYGTTGASINVWGTISSSTLYLLTMKTRDSVKAIAEKKRKRSHEDPKRCANIYLMFDFKKYSLD